MPKTAGDATLAMFKVFPGLIQFAHARDTNDKHARFLKHEKEIEGKLLIMNIRRLPSWILSFAHHKSQYGLYPERKPLPMDSSEEMARSAAPDRLLHSFMAEGRFNVGAWLRTEHLADDFLELISQFTEVRQDQESQIRNLERVNQLKYDHELERWFTRDQVFRMYLVNPLWTSVEQGVYGELVLDGALGNSRSVKASGR